MTDERQLIVHRIAALKAASLLKPGGIPELADKARLKLEKKRAELAAYDAEHGPPEA